MVLTERRMKRRIETVLFDAEWVAIEEILNQCGIRLQSPDIGVY